MVASTDAVTAEPDDSEEEMPVIEFKEGAQWVRADFHLHTRADSEFQWSNAAGNDYENQYVAALKQADIRIGCITNHDKFDESEFKRLRRKARQAEMELLPGVELTVGEGAGGVHTLIIFSDEWLQARDSIGGFLTWAHEEADPTKFANAHRGTPKNLLEILAYLEKTGRDFFVVFAHVEDDKGLWHELSGGRLTDFGKNEVFRRCTLGFQKVKENSTNKDNVKRWLSPWYPAEVEGSDPKAIQDIGQCKTAEQHERKCYLKVGTLTFEAVKFALQNYLTRVSHEKPKHQSAWIRSAMFDGGIFDGKTIHFASELNTLIGIRGSGKSAVLEAVRYALGMEVAENSSDQKYKNKLVEFALGSGGKVSLEIQNALGQTFTVSRVLGEKTEIWVDGVPKEGLSVAATGLQQVLYLGQNELSGSYESYEGDLLRKLIGTESQELTQQIEVQKGRVRSAVAQYLSCSRVEDQIEDCESRLKNIEFQQEKFKEHGVADKLEQQVSFSRDANAVGRMVDVSRRFDEAIRTVLADIEDDVRNAFHYSTKYNQDFFDGFYKKSRGLTEALETLKQLQGKIQTVTSDLDQQQAAFNQMRHQLVEAFAVVQRQLGQELSARGLEQIRPDDFMKLQKQQETLSQMLEVLEKQKEQKLTAETVLFSEVKELRRLWQQAYARMEAGVKALNETDPEIQIEVRYAGNREAAVDFMGLKFQGSKLQRTTFQRALGDSDDFGAMYQRMLTDPSMNLGSNPDVFRSFFQNNLSDFLTEKIPDSVVIKYQGKALRQYSLGQRASALIQLLLRIKGAEIVIIDQPEDDLDNRTIYDKVIGLVSELKPKCQFIFATHNANFPVLGDAEEVIACQLDDKQVTLNKGSIDVPSIQENIIHIMEGGREAFERRKQVYNTWKSSN